MKGAIYARLFVGSRRAVLTRAALLIAAIAVIDRLVIAQVPLQFLYLLPMLMIGAVAGRGPIIAASLLCTTLAELYSDLKWDPRTGTSRDLLYFAAFLGTGLFMREFNEGKRAAIDNFHQIEQERDARREAEEQLNILIESSPVAILTADSTGSILMANDAAYRMLGVQHDQLLGKLVYGYLPALTNVSPNDMGQQQPLRAVMQARGQREDGDAFLADISFATYYTDSGPRLAVMVLDASEDLRTHEVSGLHQVMEGSRIAVGALCHEVRNICGAISAVHQNLKRSPHLIPNKDFEALGSLVIALERLASINLGRTESQATEVDLSVFLDELKIVVMPSLQEQDVITDWAVEPGLPLVWADRSSLMQVFLNLIANSERALLRVSQRSLSISASCPGENVLLEIIDNGGGVDNPERLFRPFQAGADSTGLGLYLSRAFLRSFGGELRYRPLTRGACFIVELVQAYKSSPEYRCATSAS